MKGQQTVMGKRNNIIILLALHILLVLVGCYFLLLAPDAYAVDRTFSTVDIDEYHAFQLMIGETPTPADKFIRSEVRRRKFISVPRGQSFPFGEKTTFKINIGVASLGVSLICLVFLVYELQSRRKEFVDKGRTKRNHQELSA